MSGSISTHVLDTFRGTPAAGIEIRLDRDIGNGAWQPLGSGRAGSDGRASNMLETGVDVPSGTYRLVLDAGGYYGKLGIDSLYPEVVVVFTIREPRVHYHLPVLLGPFSYSTYRGSV